jgi:hypothetical protein
VCSYGDIEAGFAAFLTKLALIDATAPALPAGVFARAAAAAAAAAARAISSRVPPLPAAGTTFTVLLHGHVPGDAPVSGARMPWARVDEGDPELAPLPAPAVPLKSMRAGAMAVQLFAQVAGGR